MTVKSLASEFDAVKSKRRPEVFTFVDERIKPEVGELPEVVFARWKVIKMRKM